MLRITIDIGEHDNDLDERQFAEELLADIQTRVDETDVDWVTVNWRLESVTTVDIT